MNIIKSIIRRSFAEDKESGIIYPQIDDVKETNNYMIDHHNDYEKGQPHKFPNHIDPLSREPAMVGSGSLEGAIARPQAGYGGHDEYPTIVEKATVLAHGLGTAHVFKDANHRTALAIAIQFLEHNGFNKFSEYMETVDDTKQNEFVDTIRDVISGKISLKDYTNWFRKEISNYEMWKQQKKENWKLKNRNRGVSTTLKSQLNTIDRIIEQQKNKKLNKEPMPPGTEEDVDWPWVEKKKRKAANEKFDEYQKAIKDKFDIDITDFKPKLKGAKPRNITDFQLAELLKGIKSEQEHTADTVIALEIATDHLSEIEDYYTRLNKMEKKGQTDFVQSTVFKVGDKVKYVAERGWGSSGSGKIVINTNNGSKYSILGGEIFTIKEAENPGRNGEQRIRLVEMKDPDNRVFGSHSFELVNNPVARMRKSQTIFKIGDDVRCINNKDFEQMLTQGKTYVVVGLGNQKGIDRITVVDDKGNRRGFFVMRFVLGDTF